MGLGLVLLITLLVGCAGSRLDQETDPVSRTDHASDQTDSMWTEKRRALYEQAREGLRLSRERYIATTRPVLEHRFRQEHPDFTDAAIETLVNEALAKGYRHEAESRPEGPVRLPPHRPMNCIPSPGGWPPNPGCF